MNQFNASTISTDEVIQVSSLGEGLKLTSKTTVELTIKKAEEFLDRKVFGPDRPLSDEHVNRLLNAMKRGTFRAEQTQIITCILDGEEYRMNGQHTCWARIHMDIDYRLPVSHLRYHAKSSEDMRMLYASIDRGKPRTKANVINAYLYDSEKFEGFTKATIARLAQGLALYAWCSNDKLHDGDEVAFLMQTEHLQISKIVGEVVKKLPSHMTRAGVYAAMFYTFSKNVKESLEFWDAVDTGANLEATDVRLKLRNHLMNHGVNNGRGAGGYKAAVSAEDMLAWSMQAWNAWREATHLRCFQPFKGERIKAK